MSSLALWIHVLLWVWHKAFAPFKGEPIQINRWICTNHYNAPEMLQPSHNTRHTHNEGILALSANWPSWGLNVSLEISVRKVPFMCCKTLQIDISGCTTWSGLDFIDAYVCVILMFAGMYYTAQSSSNVCVCSRYLKCSWGKILVWHCLVVCNVKWLCWGCAECSDTHLVRLCQPFCCAFVSLLCICTLECNFMCNMIWL